MMKRLWRNNQKAREASNEHRQQNDFASDAQKMCQCEAHGITGGWLWNNLSGTRRGFPISICSGWLDLQTLQGILQYLIVLYKSSILKNYWKAPYM